MSKIIKRLDNSGFFIVERDEKQEFIKALCDSLHTTKYYAEVSKVIKDIVEIEFIEKEGYENFTLQQDQRYHFLNSQFYTNFSTSVLLLTSILKGYRDARDNFKDNDVSVIRYEQNYTFLNILEFEEIFRNFKKTNLFKQRNKLFAHNHYFEKSANTHLRIVTRAYQGSLIELLAFIERLENLLKKEFGDDFETFQPLPSDYAQKVFNKE